MAFVRFLLCLVTIACGILPTFGQQAEFRTLANSLAQDIAASGRKTIAVVDFTDLQGNPTELGRYLAEEFAVAMARTHKGFDVIDRAHLKTIINEHKLTSTGLIDPATAKKLGQLVGADTLLTGSMTPFSETVRVTIKALATDTARIVAADTTDLPKTQTIAELLGRGIGTLSRPTNDRPPPGMRNEQTSPTQQPTSPVVVAEEYRYELLNCSGMGESVKCSFRITNLGGDGRIYQSCGQFWRSIARANDNFGNESWAESCTIANQDVEATAGINLVSGVPVEASIVFPKLSASATSLALIYLRLTSSRAPRFNSALFNVSFRNVPISR